MKILLVEDHEDTAQVMCLLLKRLGHEVVTTGTVAAALRSAETDGPFDLLVSDLGLPDGSGVDLMRQLRAKYGVRGVAVSGYGMEEDTRRSLDAGFVAHVIKPINFQQLQDVVAQALAHGDENP